MIDQPMCTDEALCAAISLARVRNGDSTVCTTEVDALMAAAGSFHEVARAAVLMAGALGRAILDHGALGPDVDGISIVAAGLQRAHRNRALQREALPLVAGLLTAALVTDTDALTWLDRVGPRPGQLAATIETFASLIALVDTAHAEPGLGFRITTAVFGPPGAAAHGDATGEHGTRVAR